MAQTPIDIVDALLQCIDNQRALTIELFGCARTCLRPCAQRRAADLGVCCATCVEHCVGDRTSSLPTSSSSWNDTLSPERVLPLVFLIIVVGIVVAVSLGASIPPTIQRRLRSLRRSEHFATE